MDEQISKKAALVAVKDALMAWSYMPEWRDEKILEAIAELPPALGTNLAEAGTDCISRQAAIDALDEQIEQCDKALSSFDISMRDEFAVKVERASLVAFRETLEYLSSAEPEIIRCRDCKYNATSKKCLNPNSFFLVPADDDFCSYAERREDE